MVTMLLLNKHFINKYLIITIILFNLLLIYNCLADNLNLSKVMPSSTPNPVGPGARGNGMGGAFIVVADDSTSSYWNPACLQNLLKKEFCIVHDSFHIIEDNEFKTNPEGNGIQTVSQLSINHVSFCQPFYARLFYLFPKAHHVISFNYQKQYDFAQKWDLTRIIEDVNYRASDNIDYKCSGILSSIGIAYSLLVRENFSFGIVFNFYNDDLTKNKWEQISYQELIRDNEIIEKALSKETYSFNGYNANIGILWQNIFDNNGLYKINMGLILKAPFNADIEHSSLFVNSKGTYTISHKKETMKMPLSYGLGLALVSNDFNLALDIYKTKWNDFIDTDSSIVIRIGAEHLYKKNKYIIPFRYGFIYDEAPAKKSKDKFWGITLGTGIEFIDKCSFDIAYQFKFANNVRNSILESMDFSQDIREHIIFSSMILYF